VHRFRAEKHRCNERLAALRLREAEQKIDG
jgi:hypothetical protein